jgi:uncharacterized protein
VTDLIVCNTGPLIALSIVDRLNLLHILFSRILVSDQVHRELLHGGSSAGGVSTYSQATWIEQASISGAIDDLLMSVLDEGEASVIQLAREMSANQVLIDERKARKIARAVYGLNVIGTAGILVPAKRRGLLAGVGDSLAQMRESGYWIHEDIVIAARRASGEM